MLQFFWRRSRSILSLRYWWERSVSPTPHSGLVGIGVSWVSPSWSLTFMSPAVIIELTTTSTYIDLSIADIQWLSKQLISNFGMPLGNIFSRMSITARQFTTHIWCACSQCCTPFYQAVQPSFLLFLTALKVEALAEAQESLCTRNCAYFQAFLIRWARVYLQDFFAIPTTLVKSPDVWVRIESVRL